MVPITRQTARRGAVKTRVTSVNVMDAVTYTVRRRIKSRDKRYARLVGGKAPPKVGYGRRLSHEPDDMAKAQKRCKAPPVGYMEGNEAPITRKASRCPRAARRSFHSSLLKVASSEPGPTMMWCWITVRAASSDRAGARQASTQSSAHAQDAPEPCGVSIARIIEA